MTTTLTPEIAALWCEAGARIADAGLDPDVEHRAEMVAVAGVYAAAQAQAYAAESDLHRHLVFELLASGAFDAWATLEPAELRTVEMVVARCWRAIVAEFAQLRGVGEAA